MFSLIIPCHCSNLDRIFFVIKCFLNEYNNNIKNNIKLLNQIIIIFNGIKSLTVRRKTKQIVKDIKNIIPKGIIFEFEKFQARIRPGLARNASYNFIKSDYIIFHDADDEPHPNKLLINKYFFEEISVDQIHHLFQPIDLNFLEYDDFSKINYIKVDNNKIFDFTKKGLVLLNQYSKMPVSHGLISIKKNKLLEISWCDLKTGEDRDFVTKSINNNNKIIIIEAFLSKYDKLPKKSLMKYYPQYYKLWNIS